MRRADILSTNDDFYPEFATLYASSFPIFEQRTEAQQDAAFKHAGYHLAGYEENGSLVGFISYWEFDKYIYIEHFAISTAIRGKGYGSRVLDGFIRSTDKMVLLEIDPIVDAVSEARLRFYRHCGFYENPYQHKHPAYRKGFGPHQLIVLTTKRQITTEEYRDFCSDLENVVMRQET